MDDCLPCEPRAQHNAFHMRKKEKAFFGKSMFEATYFLYSFRPLVVASSFWTGRGVSWQFPCFSETCRVPRAGNLSFPKWGAGAALTSLGLEPSPRRY